jgi:hypothetical protein
MRELRAERIPIPWPVSFAYPTQKYEHYSLNWAKTKNRDFSTILPHSPTAHANGYTFTSEAEYMEAYASSWFAVTYKKSGWDCMRHYEILASGSIPYFLDMDDLPLKTMANFPRRLVKRAMDLPGVPSRKKSRLAFMGRRSVFRASTMTSLISRHTKPFRRKSCRILQAICSQSSWGLSFFNLSC